MKLTNKILLNLLVFCCCIQSGSLVVALNKNTSKEKSLKEKCEIAALRLTTLSASIASATVLIGLTSLSSGKEKSNFRKLLQANLYITQAILMGVLAYKANEKANQKLQS